MTMGQLIRHLTNPCGWGCRGFVTGEWGLPEGKTWADLTPDENLPAADQLPSSASVAEAKPDRRRSRALSGNFEEQAAISEVHLPKLLSLTV